MSLKDLTCPECQATPCMCETIIRPKLRAFAKAIEEKGDTILSGYVALDMTLEGGDITLSKEEWKTLKKDWGI